MIKFPMTFDVEAKATSGISNNWIAQGNHFPPIPSAIPPEFMGPGGGYSPEELFGIAIINCLVATYKVYCERHKVIFETIQAKASIKLAQDSSTKALFISNVDVTLDVSGAPDIEQATKQLKAAHMDCAISNSIKSCTSFHLNVTG